jgi:hypothetical protein
MLNDPRVEAKEAEEQVVQWNHLEAQEEENVGETRRGGKN